MHQGPFHETVIAALRYLFSPVRWEIEAVGWWRRKAELRSVGPFYFWIASRIPKMCSLHKRDVRESQPAKRRLSFAEGSLVIGITCAELRRGDATIRILPLLGRSRRWWGTLKSGASLSSASPPKKSGPWVESYHLPSCYSFYYASVLKISIVDWSCSEFRSQLEGYLLNPIHDGSSHGLHHFWRKSIKPIHPIKTPSTIYLYYFSRVGREVNQGCGHR